MHIENNTILITGGATGIGFALAEQFLAANNTVIICGRREEALQAAQSKLPGLQIRVADLNSADERRSLAQWTSENFPNLNILVNNAGIQRVFRVKEPNIADDFINENEIETNLTAPTHLTFLLLPHLLKQKEAAVANISSGLGFVPIAVLPVYCATKAALQSFSTSLRYQLRETSVKVFDVAPPLVETDLHEAVKAKRDQRLKGISPDRVAEPLARQSERLVHAAIAVLVMDERDCIAARRKLGHKLAERAKIEPFAFVFLRLTDDISGRRAILEKSKAKLIAFCPKL